MVARICIVDDDLGTRETFSLLLQLRHHEVQTAESGAEALELMQSLPHDVALIDLMLPDMTGLDVLRELRTRGIRTSCVVMTGFGTIESAVDAMKLGAVDYVTKPLEPHDLERVLDQGSAGRLNPAPATIQADGMARWATAIASVLDAPRDPKHLLDWSRLRGVAPETLRAWCRTAAVSPKESLDLARVLRAVTQARVRGWAPSRLLDVADRRTLERLLVVGGLVPDRDAPTLESVLQAQSFVTDPAALHELRRVLRECGVTLDG